jgi:hypothetical protein
VIPSANLFSNCTPPIEDAKLDGIAETFMNGAQAFKQTTLNARDTDVLRDFAATEHVSGLARARNTRKEQVMAAWLRVVGDDAVVLFRRGHGCGVADRRIIAVAGLRRLPVLVKGLF